MEVCLGNSWRYNASVTFPEDKFVTQSFNSRIGQQIMNVNSTLTESQHKFQLNGSFVKKIDYKVANTWDINWVINRCNVLTLCVSE